MEKNEGFPERMIQSIVSALLFTAAVFWLGGFWVWIAGFLALAVAFFAVKGFCPLYALLGINKRNIDEVRNFKTAIIFAMFAGVLIGGGYASNFFSKKFFVEDFNAMNRYYKQTLFETGQEKRAEAIVNYDLLVSGYADFQEKYSTYRPYALRGDDQFAADLKKIERIIMDSKQDIYEGDLKKSHLALEQVRPITQEMFKRNGFSMLAIALVDFHDSMEKVLEAADEKDAVKVISAYREADDKLAAVEVEADDAEIQLIRKNLEALLKSAQDGKLEELPNKAAELKSSFVKVYLKRG